MGVAQQGGRSWAPPRLAGQGPLGESPVMSHPRPIDFLLETVQQSKCTGTDSVQLLVEREDSSEFAV